MTGNRSLTEELQSVLRSKSMDAPAPSTAIAEILDRTIGAAATDTTMPRSRLSLVRNRFRASSLILSAAAVAAVVVLIGVAVVGDGGGPNAEKSSGGAGSAAGPPQLADGLPASPASGVQGGIASPGPSANFGSSAASGGGAVTFTPVRCPDPTQLGSVSTLGTLTLAKTAAATTGRALSIIATTCTGPKGIASSSQVDVETDDGTLVRTLISQAQGVQADFGTVIGSTITVRGYSPSEHGSFDYAFEAAADGKTFTALRPSLYANDCTAGGVSLAITADADATDAVLIQVRNTGVYPCVMRGYPDVTAISEASRAVASQTLRGANGGVGGSVAPIVVLNPGGTASALAEARLPVAASCAATDHLRVQFGGYGLDRTFPSTLAGCGLEVHPLITGQSGSG
ncbi:DUF4232 domain-containing protein [Jatrophihabitans sp. DSM 45814]